MATFFIGGLHAKHAVQRCILSTNSAFALGPRKTTENLDRVGPAGCKLTSSQQSAIKYSSPNITHYLCYCFIIENVYKFVLQKCLCAYNMETDIF
jgi:hypothetical protein